jgi:hypothetical protein
MSLPHRRIANPPVRTGCSAALCRAGSLMAWMTVDSSDQLIDTLLATTQQISNNEARSCVNAVDGLEQQPLDATTFIRRQGRGAMPPPSTTGADWA